MGSAMGSAKVPKSDDPDLTSDGSVEISVAPEDTVQIGVRSPENWTASLSRDGYVGWLADESGTFVIAPGKSLGGFELVSKSPPGPRSFTIVPELSSDSNAPFEIYGEDCEEMPDCETPIEFDVKGKIAGPDLASEIEYVTYDGLRTIGTALLNSAMRFAYPTEFQVAYPANTTAIDLIMVFGKYIYPNTFKGTINGQEMCDKFVIEEFRHNVVRVPLQQGRNTLALSINVLNTSGSGKMFQTVGSKFTIQVK